MKKVVVFGAGGFIGWHLVKRLKDEGCHVLGVDIKAPLFDQTKADVFVVADCRNEGVVAGAMDNTDEVYQLAANMGGAGFVFTGDHDAQIMQDNTQINLNVAKHAHECGRVFFSSSACIYPEGNQKDEEHPITAEYSAYPANPDSEYGWEKLYAERMYLAEARCKGADCRIARFHNIYGPMGVYRGGKEKAPAAICRKVAEAKESIPIWGDGEQTRSFLYIDDCIDGILVVMRNEKPILPVNIGSSEMVSINRMAEMVMKIAGKSLRVEHEAGPLGVRGRTSDNHYCEFTLGWKPKISLEAGLAITYWWIAERISKGL